MLRILKTRLQQKHRTIDWPAGEASLPERLRGRPELNAAKCRAGCAACTGVCPTAAVTAGEGKLAIDLGRCLFCGDCQAACPAGAIRFRPEHRLAARERAALAFGGDASKLTAALGRDMRRLFGRSLKLRQVSAGGCNACEADINVLTTVVFDLGRFGIQIVASPRHADGLLVTGPVSRNMALALKKTYDALPPPRIVVALGACAISGGPYLGHAEALGGAASVVPVDLYIPGCPPHPLTILDGLLRMLGRLPDDATARR